MQGCVSAAKNGDKTPARIIIRNSGSENLRSVVLGAPASRKGISRYGMISPVPAGVSQVFVRPDDARPLLSVVNISWTTDSGAQYSKDVDLKDLLKEVRKCPQSTLVFEVLPGGRSVRAFLE
jgi:hypothetical protein